jgi:hypothetical protein
MYGGREWSGMKRQMWRIIREQQMGTDMNI